MSNLEIASVRPREEFDAWLLTQAPVQAEHGPAYHLAVLPFTDGGSGISLVLSHCLSHCLADTWVCAKPWRTPQAGAAAQSAGPPPASRKPTAIPTEADQPAALPMTTVPGDTRANAVTNADITVGRVPAPTDLREIRATIKQAPIRHRDEPSARWALMPLVPLLPKGLVKRLVTVAAGGPSAVVASNLGACLPARPHQFERGCAS